MHKARCGLRCLGLGGPATRWMPLRTILSPPLGRKPSPTELQCPAAQRAELGLGIWVHHQSGAGLHPAAGALSFQLTGVEQRGAAPGRHPHLSSAGALPNVAGQVDGVYPNLRADQVALPTQPRMLAHKPPELNHRPSPYPDTTEPAWRSVGESESQAGQMGAT